jgi:hypothetical protein
MLETRVPAMPDVADAFDFLLEPMPLGDKYGERAPTLNARYSELVRRLDVNG